MATTRIDIEIVQKGLETLDRVGKGVDKLNQSAGKATASLSNLGEAIKAVVAGGALVSFLSRAAAAYEDTNKAVSNLNRALQQSGQYSESNVQRLNAQAAALSAVSGVMRSQIQLAQGYALQVGTSIAETEKLTQVIANLADVSDQSFEKVRTSVIDAISTGQLSGELRRITGLSEARFSQQSLSERINSLTLSAPGQSQGTQFTSIAAAMNSISSDLGKLVDEALPTITLIANLIRDAVNALVAVNRQTGVTGTEEAAAVLNNWWDNAVVAAKEIKAFLTGDTSYDAAADAARVPSAGEVINSMAAERQRDAKRKEQEAKKSGSSEDQRDFTLSNLYQLTQGLKDIEAGLVSGENIAAELARLYGTGTVADAIKATEKQSGLIDARIERLRLLLDHYQGVAEAIDNDNSKRAEKGLALTDQQIIAEQEAYAKVNDTLREINQLQAQNVALQARLNELALEEERVRRDILNLQADKQITDLEIKGRSGINFGGIKEQNQIRQKATQDSIDSITREKGLTTDPARVAELDAQISALTLRLHELKAAGTEVSSVFASNLTSAFDSLIDRTASIQDAFKNLVEGMINDIAKLIARAAAMRIALSLFGVNGAIGDAGLGDLLKGVGGFNRGGIVPGFANGGIVPQGPGSIPYADSVLIGATPGEAVLTEAMSANLNSKLQGKGGNVTVFTVLSEDGLASRLQGTAGQQVIVHNVIRNKSTVSQGLRG